MITPVTNSNSWVDFMRAANAARARNGALNVNAPGRNEVPVRHVTGTDARIVSPLVKQLYDPELQVANREKVAGRLFDAYA